MKKLIFLLLLLAVITVIGCATEQGSTVGYERSSGHAGHHH